MRHGFTKKLGRTKSHRKAMLRNLVSQLFTYERIETTLAKAKLAQRLAERLLAFAGKGTLAARREVARYIADKKLLKKVFDVIAPRFSDHRGGYTRVYRLGRRVGDAAEMAILELVIREESHKEKRARAEAKKAGSGRRKEKKAVSASRAKGKSESKES